VIAIDVRLWIACRPFARRTTMRSALLSLSTIIFAACNALQSSPVAPSASGPPPVPAPVPSELRAFYAPTGVYGGGATQIHAAVYGYDERGFERRVRDVPVGFSATRGGHLTVLSGHTYGTEDAVALMDVDRAAVDYDIEVTVTSPVGRTVLRVTVCACLAPPPTPSPAPSPSPPPPPTPTAPAPAPKDPAVPEVSPR
jgi:hypothetical protein